MTLSAGRKKSLDRAAGGLSLWAHGNASPAAESLSARLVGWSQWVDATLS